eukprot:NODE_82_length_22625_cov_0.476516.p8 type:complete len:237 gc:universal NODE_82_length_22625_cov_0.476516:3838-3128(-)
MAILQYQIHRSADPECRKSLKTDLLTLLHSVFSHLICRQTRNRSLTSYLRRSSQISKMTKIICKWNNCEAQIEGDENALKHLSEHVGFIKHATFSNECKWHGCVKTKSTRGNMISHLLTHVNIYMFQCKCGKTSKRKYDHKIHLKTCSKQLPSSPQTPTPLGSRHTTPHGSPKLVNIIPKMPNASSGAAYSLEILKKNEAYTTSVKKANMASFNLLLQQLQMKLDEERVNFSDMIY